MVESTVSQTTMINYFSKRWHWLR